MRELQERKNSIVWAAFALGVSFVVGCSPARSAFDAHDAKFTQQFPTRDTLAALESKAAPALKAKPSAVVDSWTIDTPIPAVDAPADATSPFGKLVAEAVAKRASSLVASAALDCAAHEIATFIAKKGAPPTEGLRRFIQLRCGSTLGDVSIYYVTSTGAVADDATLAKNAAGMMRDAFGKLDSGKTIVGLSGARVGDKNAVVLTYAPATASLRTEMRASDGGKLAIVSGTAPAGATGIVAMVTSGEAGFERCLSTGASAPAFSFACPIAAKDHKALVQIAATPTAGLFAHTIGYSLVHDDDPSTLTWTTSIPIGKTAATDAATLRSQILTRLNTVRTTAGFSPLTLLPAQSETNTKLAPHFFSAILSGDDDLAERIALGVLAGWDVGTGMTIRTGGVSADYTDHVVDGDGWVAAALETPFARASLLDPNVSAIAIGALAGPDGQGVAALASTYGFFVGDAHGPMTRKLDALLAAQRAARGLGKPTRIDGLSALKRAADDISERGRNPSDALNDSMAAVMTHTGKSVRGVAYSLGNPEAIEFAPQLFRAGNVSYALEVTHRQLKGFPWGEWIVLVVWTEDETVPTTTARAGVSTRSVR